MAILQHIELMSNQLAESEGKVAAAILADPTALEHYTITRLAQQAGTSTSAVLRFCHSLGFAGYKDFRYELVSEVRHNTMADAEGADALSLASEGLSSAVGRLAELNRTDIARMATQIMEASAVFCIGIHRSFLPAEKLRMDLEDLGIMAISCRDSVQATHMVNLMDERSCKVLFSESGAQSSYRTSLDAGITQQGHSWLVTSNPRAQLTTHVEHAIVLPSTKRVSILTIDQHAVALAFVELLILQIREQLSCAQSNEMRDA